MARTFHHGQAGRDRPIRVRGIRRTPPDVRKIARVLIELARAQAEAEAEAERRSASTSPKQKPTDTTSKRTPTEGDAA